MEPDTNSNLRKVVQASEILAKIERGDPVEYASVIVEGDLDLSGLELPTEHVDRTEKDKLSRLLEERKVISSQITITNSEIRGKVNFSNARFQELVNFGGEVEFGGDTDFEGAKFDGDAHFPHAKFGGSTNFSETEFSDCVLFYDTVFSGNVYFWKAKFVSGFATFERAKFDGEYASFMDAEFSGSAEIADSANFSGTEFSGEAHFEGAKFIGGYAHFHNAKFGGGASFEKAKFSGEIADFRKAEFNGKGATFEKAEFTGGSVNFLGAKFSGNIADFKGAKFTTGRTVHFFGAKFLGVIADFRGAKFTGGSVRLDRVEFSEDADFRKAEFCGSGAHLKGVQFSGPMRIRWKYILDKKAHDFEFYSALRENYKILGWFVDADSCYYQIRKTLRKDLPFYYMPIDWILMILYGYGVKPLWTLFWSLVSILIFGIFFCSTISGINPLYAVENTANESLGISSICESTNISSIEYFIFSSAVFLSGTKLFVDPPNYTNKTGMPIQSVTWSKRIFTFERVMGALLSLMFLSAVGRAIITR